MDKAEEIGNETTFVTTTQYLAINNNESHAMQYEPDILVVQSMLRCLDSISATNRA